MLDDGYGSGEKKKRNEMEPEGMMFSRTAVTNSLLSKLIPESGGKKTPAEQLEKRLSLLAH